MHQQKHDNGDACYYGQHGVTRGTSDHLMHDLCAGYGLGLNKIYYIIGVAVIIIIIIIITIILE